MQCTVPCNTDQKRKKTKPKKKKGHRTLLEQGFIHKGEKKKEKKAGALFCFFCLVFPQPRMNLSKQTRQKASEENKPVRLLNVYCKRKLIIFNAC